MASRPLVPAADDEQAVAGAQAAAVEGAQHAGQRLDEGRALGVEAVEHEQLADEVGRHAHLLGEAARVQGRGLEALAQRLVAAPAAPALAARRVVVHDDAIAHGDALDLGADRGDLGRQLVAEHGRHLARDPRVEDVRAAHAARQHAADDVAAARLGVGRLLDADLARRQRARDPHASSAAIEAASGGRATPRSVTRAVTSAAGVTSNAGLRTAVPGSVVCAAAEGAHLVAVALLDRDAVAVGQRGVDGRRRAGDDERDPGRAGGQRQRIGADLVGGVAVGGDAVGADDRPRRPRRGG